MVWKLISVVVLLMSAFLGRTQTKVDSFEIVTGELAQVYYKYQINGIWFSFCEFGTELRIQPKHLFEGKQYFRKRILGIFGTESGGAGGVPPGTMVKPFLGDCVQVDTFIFAGIVTKHPLEIDGKAIRDEYPYSTQLNPIIIRDFRYVERCEKYPFRHFEIFTENKFSK